MYQSKKELRKQIEQLMSDCEKLREQYDALKERLNPPVKCIKSMACFSCRKMIAGKKGDVKSVVCKEDVQCKQYDWDGFPIV